MQGNMLTLERPFNDVADAILQILNFPLQTKEVTQYLWKTKIEMKQKLMHKKNKLFKLRKMFMSERT